MTDLIKVVRLRISDQHAAELNRQAKAVNVVWNYCNDTQRKAVRSLRQWLTDVDLMRLTAGSSKDLDLHAHTIQCVCKTYFRSRLKNTRPWLRWRGKKSLGWVPFNTGHVRFDGTLFSFRNVNYRPLHYRPDLVREGDKFGAGSFSADSKGHWYINLPVKVACAETNYAHAVGVDLGLKRLATLSDGGRLEAPRFYRLSEQGLAANQRARKSTRVRAIQAKARNRRKDFLHKASTALAKEYGTIVIGDVSPSKLVKTRMAKSVYDAGWAGFKLMLSYKAMMHGGRLIEVSETMTTQTCSTCGAIPVSRPKGIAGLGIREWSCDCGAVHDRDVNAALNILRVGLDTLVEGVSR